MSDVRLVETSELLVSFLQKKSHHPEKTITVPQTKQNPRQDISASNRNQKITMLSSYIALEETKKEMQETAMKLMLFGEKRAYLCLMFDIEKACKEPEKKKQYEKMATFY